MMKDDDELDEAKIDEIFAKTHVILQEKAKNNTRYNTVIDNIVKAIKEVVSEDEN